MSSNDRSIDRSIARMRLRPAKPLVVASRIINARKTSTRRSCFYVIFFHIQTTHARESSFFHLKTHARMPPRRLIPGEGAKYQNAVAYKADLHVKTSESAQKVLASLKNQALQNICKRCREKIECALFCCRCFCRRKYRYTCAYAFRVFGHFVVVVVVVVVGWVSTVSLFSFAISFYLSLSLCVCVCSSRRAVETRTYPNSHAHLTFSLAHNNTHTQGNSSTGNTSTKKARAY